MEAKLTSRDSANIVFSRTLTRTHLICTMTLTLIVGVMILPSIEVEQLRARALLLFGSLTVLINFSLQQW
jgi:hypothetical protein